MPIDYTQIIGSIITLAVAVITTFLIPWLKERYGAEKLMKWQQYVNIAVEAAEQIYAATEGDAKKAYVLKYLNEQGIVFDADTVDKMIESAVLLLHAELGLDK